MVTEQSEGGIEILWKWVKTKVLNIPNKKNTTVFVGSLCWDVQLPSSVKSGIELEPSTGEETFATEEQVVILFCHLAKSLNTNLFEIGSFSQEPSEFPHLIEDGQYLRVPGLKIHWAQLAADGTCLPALRLWLSQRFLPGALKRSPVNLQSRHSRHKRMLGGK